MVICLLTAVPAGQAFSDPLGPTGLLEINYSQGSLDTDFIFEAGKSVNASGFKTGLTFRYNFEYGDTDFTAWTTNPVANYQYTKAGTKIILLEVRDADGRVDRVTSQIEVKASPALSGQFSVDRVEGDLQTEFNFFATIFTGGGESQRRFWFRWDFDGDGVFDTIFQQTPVATYIYAQAGTFSPALEVKDEFGTTLTIIGYHTGNKDIGKISIGKNRMPEAAIIVFPKTGEAGITIFSLDSSLSSDESGRSDFEVRFDFENDGRFDTDFSNNPKLTHVYKNGGKKEILVQIRSASGKTDSAIAAVEIFEKNSLPVADLYITNNSQTGDYLSGTIGTEFTFSAQGSADAEDSGNLLEARFDFNGDGIFDTVFSNTKIAKHKYLEIGNYSVNVEVKDTLGARSQSSKTITVVNNEAPRGTIKISPLSGPPATKFDFNISNLIDSQNLSGYIQSRIDYDGDGSFDTDFSYRTFYSYAYNRTGTFTPLVQIKDRFGQTTDLESTVTVFGSNPPVAFFTVKPSSGNFNTTFQFDASGSEDQETPLKNLRFRWDFEYTGVNDIIFDTGFAANPKTVNIFSGQTGERRIRLEVEDSEGNRVAVIKSIFLHWASPYLQDLARRGIISGINGNFRPDVLVTRSELVKMVMLGAKISGNFQFKGYFSDVKSSDWFWKYVENAKDANIVKGINSSQFGPHLQINRAEALKIILLAFKQPLMHNCSGQFTDVQDSDWFARYICTGFRLGIVKGYEDGAFHPERSITRAEAAKLISLLINPNY